MIARPYLQFYVGENQFVIHERGATRVYQLDAAATQMLRMCARAASLDEHRALIDRAAGGMLPVSRLDELLHSDHLIDPARLAAAIARPAPSRPRPITTVAIPTADRPRLLRRCLASLVAHCSRHGESPRILVVDGSREPANRVQNRATVAATAASWPAGAIHVSITDSAALRAAWVRRGLDAALASFALFSGEAGANRNLILALTRGEHVLMMDDDVLCDTWAPEHAEGLMIGGHEDVCRTASFATRADTLASIEVTNQDLLAAHARLLGRDLDELVPSNADAIAVGSPCATLLEALEAGGAGRVVLTFAGLAGDSGIFCPYRALFNEPAPGHIGDLSPGEYELTVTSRERTRIAPQDAVTHDQHCMAYCMGVANDQPLPPFMPIGRNQDGLFGALLGACDDRAFVGHLACGVVHDADRPSRFEQEMPSASEVRLADLLITLLPRYPVERIPSGVARMRWLGSCLTQMAELPAERFQSEVLRAFLQKRSAELASAERVINAGGGSGPYQRDVDRYRQRFLAALAEQRLIAPVEFHDRNDGATFQGVVGRYGELVHAWPAMLDNVGADVLELAVTDSAADR